MDEWGTTDFMVLRRAVLAEIDGEIVVLAHKRLQEERFGVTFAEVAPHVTKWMNKFQDE